MVEQWHARDTDRDRRLRMFLAALFVAAVVIALIEIARIQLGHRWSAPLTAARYLVIAILAGITARNRYRRRAGS